jgi:simple sugar transport system permease protein
MTTQKVRELFKVKDVSAVLFPVISILVGLIGGAIIIWVMGFNPLTAYKEILFGSFGTKYGFFGAVLRFIPLAFGGLAVTVAFKGGVFNIGAEGQLYMGALLSTWVAVSFPNLPAFVLIPFALAAGAVGGGVWAFIPAFLKATRGFNEILVTIFMNYIGIFVLGACVSTFLRAPNQSIIWTSRIPDPSKLPRIPGSNIHVGVILIFVFAILLWYVLHHRTLGYQIRAVGLNTEASKYGGMNTNRMIIITMVISGCIASFAGSVEILGVQHRLREGFLVGYGYTAIPIALLGGLHPYGTLAAAFIYGVLLNGASSMQVSMGVPVPVVHIIVALSILSVIGVNGLRKVWKK